MIRGENGARPTARSGIDMDSSVAIVVVKMTKDVDGLPVSETTFEKACLTGVPKKLNNEASSVSTDEVCLLELVGLDLSVKERNGRGGSDS